MKITNLGDTEITLAIEVEQGTFTPNGKPDARHVVTLGPGFTAAVGAHLYAEFEGDKP